MKMKCFLLGTLLLVGTHLSVAQLIPASAPIADPSDKRFEGVQEDWNSPAQTTSDLRAALPMVGYVAAYPTYTIELVQLQWRVGDPIDLYVMKPRGIAHPAPILYLYGYPADTDRFKDPVFQQKVTKDEFAAVGFVSALTGHRYHDRPMHQWFVSELQESLATSAHDVQMVLNYLETRGDLDMKRVGMFAQGSGASIAILASAVDPRIQALDVLDPWGDWPNWLAYSPFVPNNERSAYVRPEFLRQVAGLEPVEWMHQLKAKQFRLQDAQFESNTPKAAKERMRAAVPDGATIAIYRTSEDFDEVVRAGRDLEWIHHALQSTSGAGGIGTGPKGSLRQGHGVGRER
jgi:hypothetical protein